MSDVKLGQLIDGEAAVQPERFTSWFRRGQEARKRKVKLKDTIVYQLRFGCHQQDEFLDGYDNPKIP